MDYGFIFMLAGVLMASYAVLANDFLQTLSAFYSANQGRIAWGWQWGFICAVLVITAVSGWYVSGGDLGFGQLDLIPRPATFGWHHAVAPAVLLGVTMLRLPVSTTLMILSAFTTSLQLEQILTRSFLSYVGALLLGYGAWYVLSRWLNYNEFKPMSPKNRWFWLATLWGATAFMWVLWLRHDLANIVVFMPRHLSGFEVIVILGVMCGVLALLFHQKGGPIQIVMVDKTGHDQLRSAALINLVYGLLLLGLLLVERAPLSTTWAYVGLLTGREMVVYHHQKGYTPKKNLIPVVLPDLMRILLGLAIGVAMVLVIRSLHLR